MKTYEQQVGEGIGLLMLIATVSGLLMASQDAGVGWAFWKVSELSEDAREIYAGHFIGYIALLSVFFFICARAVFGFFGGAKHSESD